LIAPFNSPHVALLAGHFAGWRDFVFGLLLLSP